MKRILLATAAMLAMTQAQAADLPAANAFKAAAQVPTFNYWTGCYMGMEAGGVAGPTTDNSPAAAGTMGCNYQFGSAFVYGLEMDAGAAKTVSPIATTFGFTGDVSARLGYHFALNTSIAGINFTNSLAYVKANLAVIDLSGPVTSGMKTGPGFSVGLENVVATCTTLGPEYRWSEVNNVRSNTYVMVMRVYGGC